MISGKLKEDLKNPWLRGIIAAVVLTVAVNIVFISYAFWSPPGLVVKDYYERGKTYFHDEKIRKQGEASAWRLQLQPPAHISVNQEKIFRLYVMDHQGNPVRSGKVVLFVYRPSNASDDFKLPLSYADVGTFSGSVRFPKAGNWDLIARIQGDGLQFDTALRVFVEK
ncbi:MAG: FixH family protein [Mariprofundaceae bacterium]|nr:FixH family protein [Mariprofundaceae bacterium]